MRCSKIGLRKRMALELFAKLHDNNVRKHELRTLFWECTLRCNLNCRHCGSDCRTEASVPDMPVEDFIRVVDTITPHVDPNKVMVIFSGGEALVRRDLEQCGTALYERGYPWGIVTNGMLLDADRLASLVDAGMGSVTVSIDGFEEQHNHIRRNPQSFARAMSAIRLIIAEQSLVYDVVTCVSSANFDTIRQFRDYLIEQGVRRWRIFTIFPVGRAASDNEMQITDSQFVELLEFISETRREGRIELNFACEGFLGGYETEVRDGFYQCSAGVSVASVRCDGTISGCTSIRANFAQGNIYKDDFMTVWNTRFEKFRDRQWAKRDECARCREFRYCLGGGMHLRDDDERLLTCHLKRIENGLKKSF